jgi:hypothetical protein
MKLLHTLFTRTITFPTPRTLRTFVSSLLSLAFVLAAKSGWLERLPW